MSFDTSDIRRDMDVYTADNVYLGSVLAVSRGVDTVPDGEVGAAARQSSSISGEMLGPVPTEPTGNEGPVTQSAANRYAVDRDRARPIGQGTLEVGRYWGLRDRRTFRLADVQTVSLERVVLRLSAAQLPE